MSLNKASEPTTTAVATEVATKTNSGGGGGGGAKGKAEKHKIILKEVKKTPAKGKVVKPKVTPESEKKPHKKPHRFRPGTVANREIRKYQKSTDLLIPEVAIYRLVKEIFAEQGYPDLRLGKKALAVFRFAAEEEVRLQMEDARDSAQHANRITIQVKDMQHANRIRTNHPGTTLSSTAACSNNLIPALHQKRSHTSKSKSNTEEDSTATTQ